jgi:hypothetical protein
MQARMGRITYKVKHWFKNQDNGTITLTMEDETELPLHIVEILHEDKWKQLTEQELEKHYGKFIL